MWIEQYNHIPQISRIDPLDRIPRDFLSHRVYRALYKPFPDTEALCRAEEAAKSLLDSSRERHTVEIPLEGGKAVEGLAFEDSTGMVVVVTNDFIASLSEDRRGISGCIIRFPFSEN